jgi:hypothetical protein
MIAHHVPAYVTLERMDLRFGSERLGEWVREHSAMEPRSRAQFVFVGKRTWDGTGTLTTIKRLDVGTFELPRAMDSAQRHVSVSDALFAAIYQGSGIEKKRRSRRTH